MPSKSSDAYTEALSPGVLGGRSEGRLMRSPEPRIEAFETRRLYESGGEVAPSVAFVFPGQGSQWVGMGWELAEQEPVFRQALERCDQALLGQAGWSLLDELQARPGHSRLAEIEVVQPALFAIQVALAELWCSWGVRPAAVIGQSLGEVAACHVAGILSLDDAMRVVCRSSLQFKHLSGAMLVVEQSADELRSALRASPASIHLAIHTSPRSTVLSGDRAALERLAEVLEKREIFCRFVDVSFAGHSPGVAVIDSVLRRELAGLEPCPATLAMVSTVTSEAIRGPELDAAYWCRNWSQPVLFRQGIEHLASSGCDVFVELSPHPVLVGAVQDVLAVNARPGRVLPSLRRGAAREALRTSLRVLRRGAAPAPIGDPDAAEGKAVRRCDGSAELLKLLRRRAAEVLQQPEATLEDDRSLPQFGLDSLMAVELRHLLEQDLGGTLSTATLLADKGLRALSQRLTVSLEVTGAAPAIVTGGAGGGEYPLSAGQKALWFLHRLAPESSAYNVSLALAFAALPDTATLRRALVRLVGRHDALSVRFQISGDEPTQRFDDIAEIDLAVHDASSWSPAELDAALQRDAHQPFHLASEVPLRTSLYRGAPAGSVLLLVLHHIVTDFWSLAILLRDLAALLRQEASGSPAALPPLALCYKDFARWQEDWLASAAAEQQLNFWRDRLAAAPPSMQLPTDRRRPALLENRGATCLAQLGVELSTTLSDLARRRGVTVFVAALAAFQALLHRWSGQRAVALGTPMAGREVAGLADVMGYFTNPVVLCSDTSTDPTVDEWIESTQQSVLDALEHQLAPFPWLVDRLEPRREANRSPFFDILFVQEKGQRPEDQGLAASFVGRCGPSIDCGGMEAVCLPLAERDALFDLTLRMAEVDDVQMLAALYRSELYDETTIRRLLGHYLEVLRSFVAEPDPRLSQLRFLSPPERQQLLVEWGTATDVAAAENLGDVWARTVHRSPEAVAAVHGEQQLTYYDLDQRAGRLAEALCRVGAAPEHRIGLCVERGLDLLIGLLGIVRSGAAYVPLDPAHPSARLRRIAQTSDLAAVVVDSAGGQSLGRWAEMLPTLCLVGGAVAPSNESGARGTPRSPVRREQIAYCLYTSGSTGRPKGVEVSHGAATRLLRATTEIFDFAADDVWTLFHSYGFDFSVWEMWGAWASGGRLVVVPHGVSRAPASFRRLLAEQAVTVLNQTPSAFSQLSAEEIEERARDTTNLALRWVIFGGEALETRHLAGWLTRYGDQKPRLVNMYGITETTVHVTARRVRCADRTGAGEGTIGRAISDLALRVFDPRSRPVAVGVAGELNVGGAGLAQGYQGDPVATAERFVPDPHPGLGRVGARLYRSGDRVRQRPDGSLDYLARVDDQIQLRGFRIEPAEIEAVLLDHPAVHQALVRLREQGGEQRLLAYVVLAAGGGQDPTALVPALRERLGRQLPDYMQPSAILCLDRWPLTAHGKLDHQALPLPSGRRPDLAAAYTAPDSEAELLVASIWREVLALDRVGADDNFFEAGGHSLQLTRVHRRLISRGYDVSIVDLLRWPTIRSLARCLGRSAPSSVGAVRRQPARRPLRRQGAIRRRHRAARGAAGE